MERIKDIIVDDNSNVRVYLLKKKGYKGQYEAVVFPNALDQKIKETYATNYEHFCGERKIAEYDSVHSEKGTIKKNQRKKKRFVKSHDLCNLYRNFEKKEKKAT